MSGCTAPCILFRSFYKLGYTEMETMQARIVKASDLQARRISAAENLQREDLSAVEMI